MYCSVHHQKEAGGICVYCGKFFCEDCLVEINGKYYCKEHVKELIGGNRVDSTFDNPNPNLHHTHHHSHGHNPHHNNNGEPREGYRVVNEESPKRTFWDDSRSTPPPPSVYERTPIIINNSSYGTPCGSVYERTPIIINNSNHGVPYGSVSPKSRLVALLLCLFFGVAGFHRFYAGKIGTGLIWLFTGGFFGIGYIVDLIMIICGSFRDNYDRIIKIW